jgi:uridine kinase
MPRPAMPRPATPAEVVTVVQRLASRPRAGTVWVGIDGRGVTGKTTLAEQLAGAAPDVDVVHVDDFWGPSIATWDVDRFRSQVLEPLVAGRRARYQIWNWEDDVGGDWAEVAPGRLLVVEGVSATTARLAVPWSLRVWVDAPRELRLARALARDGEAMLPRWLEDWMPSEEAYIAAEHPERRADLLVTSG